MFYLKSKKFNRNTLIKVCEALEITKDDFFNYNQIESKSNKLQVSPTSCNSSLESLKILQKQLNEMNKMLEKALDNESKLLDLLEKQLS